MSKLLFLAGVVGLAISFVAQSQPPPPTPAKATEEKQQFSGGKNSYTNPAQQPTVVPTEKSESAKSQGGDSDSKSSTDWWIVIFTGALMLVGVTQLVAMFKQGDYMRRGLRVSINAAKSARFGAIAAQRAVRLAEHNTSITERAVILIESVVAKPQIGGAHPYFSANSVLVYTLKNYGSTVAYEVKTKGTIYYPGGVRNFSDKAGSTIAGTTIAPQGRNEWISDPMFRAHPQQDSQITIANQGEGIVRYNIEVTYKDAFQKTHVYKAEGEYIPVLRAFTIMGSTSD